MSLTLSARNSILPTLVGGTVYIGLHSANPGDSGSANEITGGGYSRQPATFTINETTGTAALTEALTFSVTASTTLTYISMWANSTGGDAFERQALTAPVTVTSGTFTIAAGDITLGGAS